jgi:hypothetical protein
MTTRSLDQLLSEIKDSIALGTASRQMLQALKDEPGYSRYLELNPGMGDAINVVFNMLESLDESKKMIWEGLDKLWPEGIEQNLAGTRKGDRQILGILNNLRRQRQAERYQFPLPLD